MNKQIPDWLSQRAFSSPGSLAIIADGSRLTWADLYNRVIELASKLNSLDIKPGDRVALLAGNSLRFVETIHAISQLGAVLVPLNTRLSPAELAWQIQDIKASHLLFDEQNRDAVDAITGKVQVEHTALIELDTLPEKPFSPRQYIDLSEVHTVIYSSGTTGKPKGVLLTYGNHFWNAIASSLNMGIDKNDRWLAVLPMFHVGGLSIILRSAIYGITALLHESFNPAQVNLAIEEESVTIISVVATMLQRMLEARDETPYPTSLRCVLTGGGPVPLPLLDKCATLGIPVTQTYGMTETASQVATLSPEDTLRKLGSAGKALYPSELRIEREGEIVAPGEAGEIVVRGPIVTAGYAGRPEETNRAIKEGWLHTGDLGKIDDEGYLYVLDRRDDLIISGGENVYPAEIEAVLMGHPDVSEAGVIGKPDQRWGQVPVAAMVLRNGQKLDKNTLLKWCEDRLARYKIPAEFIFLEALPRNAAGKLVRRHLRENWSQLIIESNLRANKQEKDEYHNAL